MMLLADSKEMQVELSSQGYHQERVKWYFSAQDEPKQFLITYRITQALKLYDDVAEFNWKIWGEGWDHSLDEIVGTFDLPSQVQDDNSVYTWGHPDLNGKIAIMEHKKVIFQAFGIPSNQWVELRVAFPASLVQDPSSAVRVSGPGLQKIIDEEASYSEVFSGPGLSVLWVIALPILTVILFIFLYLRFGREPHVSSYDAIYERDVRLATLPLSSAA